MTSALGGFQIATAFVDVRANTDRMKDDVRRGVDKGTSDPAVTASAKKGGTGIGKTLAAGFAGGIAGGIVTTAAATVKDFFGSAITGASDLAETLNKSKVIFKENAASVEQWANTAAQNMGLSKAAALEAAAGFGNMFTQLGFSGKAATDMAKNVVELSADLGSFNNLPTAEVSDMISAAFRGEFDSLQRLIPNINAARVETEAMAMTGKKSAKELTAQEKAAAVLAIVQKDGAAAAEDFANTADGLANSQKIATAQFADAAAKLGTLLLPAMSAVMNLISTYLVPAVETLTRFLWDNKEIIGLVSGVIIAAYVPAMITAGVTSLVQGANIARGWLMALGPIGWTILAVTSVVAALIYAWKHSETFRSIVTGALAGVAVAATWLWGTILKPVIDFIVAGFQLLGSIISWWWANIVSPVFSVIGIAAKILAAIILTVLIVPLYLAFQLISWAVTALWQVAFKPAFEGIGALAHWLWDNALRPVFDFIRAGLRAVGDFFIFVWNTLIRPAIDAWAAQTRLVWETVIRPVWEALKAGLRAVGDFFGFVWNALIRPVWDAVGNGIRAVWDRFIRPAFDALRGGVDGVGRSFQNVADWIGQSWDSIREKARRPVQWVVDVVYNNGIRRVWNGIAGVFGLSPLGEVRFAEGGVLPGFTPGRDIHRFISPTGASLWLSGGEAVMRPEWTRTVGPAYVAAANAAARRGGAAGVRQFLTRTAPRPGEGARGDGTRFADGGIIGFTADLFTKGPATAIRGLFSGALGDSTRTPGTGLWRDSLVRFPGVIVDKLIEKADSWLSSGGGAGKGLAWARTQVGKPYIWGGVGPGGYDCSGLMSAVARVIRGQPPHARIGATGSFPWPGFLPGWGPGFTIGSFDGNPGHMAGTIAGINVESSGGVGVRVGGGARGAGDRMFTTRAHLADYDQGGMLPPGLSMAYNGTGQPEGVFTQRQMRELLNQDRGPVTINVIQQSGSPAETGRLVALALRTVG